MISTDRLTLRRFQPGDADAFAAYRSVPEVARYQSWDAPVSLETARTTVAHANTWFKGEWTDDLLFGLLRSDWLS